MERKGKERQENVKGKKVRIKRERKKRFGRTNPPPSFRPLDYNKFQNAIRQPISIFSNQSIRIARCTAVQNKKRKILLIFKVAGSNMTIMKRTDWVVVT